MTDQSDKYDRNMISNGTEILYGHDKINGGKDLEGNSPRNY